MHLVHRKTCRVCGSHALTRVINLGEQYLQGSFVKPGKEMPPTRKIATSLVRCDPMRDEKACGLLQMEYTVPPEVLYSAYWYRSGTNNTMRNHLREIAEDAQNLLNKSRYIVLDIGCNDGTLLSYYPSNYKKFGIDPSDVAQEVKDDVTVIQDLFPSNELVKLLESQKCDIVTSIAMFYDLENPIEFVQGIKQILSTDGIWIFEMSYMPTMLKMNSYDTICHEHLEYYSFAIIEYILKKSGMKVVNAILNDINGGSIRCYATHSENFIYKREDYLQNIKLLRQEEFDLELDTDKPYKNFQNRINVHKEELNTLLKNLKKQGKKIHIYGASTKGNTILQWCGIDHRMIEVAAERNPDKYGAYTIGTEIPIVSEVESRAMNPDYYLVLPWHFKQEIVEREKEMLNKGVGLIFPLPDIEIVKI
ncbi:MAG: class I SAM-dependent methyltransferase [Microcystis novacekii Mn_MB_F_20050700_S1]|uniref:Class I SAM-dependent methyltransferase n=1 Tax=Microcystis novacekii Mn_MB_F_20050700_S1D TaxID=2486266 RepID=A0A552JBR7_9CHRO|nr:MAG: class I SAM-dependent methyltransferase [Microcystis novacekii Mn_MB_F_20050700_S1]TRU93208.1 MAG: class I SAM-dependent methyltransferase [Microcystis novacekii Mn_MB_F_20050700_S1D]